MRILCIIPPYIPSYFNAGHHLQIFLVGNYLRTHLSAEVTCIDAAALNITWKEICNILILKFDYVVLYNDFDAVDNFFRFMHYIKIFSPHSKTVTVGRLSKQIPRFFFQFDINAVVYDGDYEAGVLQYIQFDKGIISAPAGILLSRGDLCRKGILLDAHDWVLPDVREIPYSAYNFIYKNDFNKFCGIPERQELVVPLARGCPVGCMYCDIPIMQGKLERRLDVSTTIQYILDSFMQLPFEYFTFYAPTFTLNHQWVEQFCDEFYLTKKNFPWKCVTILKTLNDNLIKMMSKSGCVRISLGIETFSEVASESLPKCKRDSLEHFKHIAAVCRSHQIELNCFIILGLPGDTPKNVGNTIKICLENKARVRPAIYTPYHLLHEEMTVNQIFQFNRQFFVDGLYADDVANEYYKIFYQNTFDIATTVMENIPKRDHDKMNSNDHFIELPVI